MAVPVSSKSDSLDILNEGIQSATKIEPSVNNFLDVQSGSIEPVSLAIPDSLANLTSFSIFNSMDSSGNFQNLSSSTSISSLKDLGFVSPCKASPVASKGYFLRSCSKSVQETLRPIKDKPGYQSIDKVQIGDVKDLQSVTSCVGALRASALNKVSI